MVDVGIEDALRSRLRRFQANPDLRFRNTGHVYRYFDFPAADHQAFLRAESRGRFFRYYIRDHFRCERMANLHAA